MNEKATGTARAEETALAVTAETVKRYINAKATDQEITLFLNQCVMFGLNPFKREIYLIKYSEKDRATFVVGYETYLKRAERSGKWSGVASGTEDDKSGALLKAWVDISTTKSISPNISSSRTSGRTASPPAKRRPTNSGPRSRGRCSRRSR
jgi:hypothetical protein